MLRASSVPGFAAGFLVTVSDSSIAFRVGCPRRWRRGYACGHGRSRERGIQPLAHFAGLVCRIGQSDWLVKKIAAAAYRVSSCAPREQLHHRLRLGQSLTPRRRAGPSTHLAPRQSRRLPRGGGGPCGTHDLRNPRGSSERDFCYGSVGVGFRAAPSAQLAVVAAFRRSPDATANLGNATESEPIHMSVRET
jgi:hypothetical protein